MVKLDKIYTRGGDGGRTSLGSGKRVLKHDPNITALGAIDEANAAIGVARLRIDGDAGAMLARIQNDLFDLGADLATPLGSRTDALRITKKQVERLEAEIDVMNVDLAPLDSFVLPGGSEANAYLHLARAVMRRAEGLISKLAVGNGINPLAQSYANRLSDHLFVLSRSLNKGCEEQKWQPGGNA